MAKHLSTLHINTERTWRGGERQTFFLVRELAKREHNVWLACRPGYPLHQKAQEEGIPTVDINPWSEMGFLTARVLRRFCEKKGVDLIHAHTGHAVGLGVLTTLGTSIPLIATRRVDFFPQKNILSRWKYSRLNHLAVISQKILEIMVSYGHPSQKMSVIHSGIDSTGYPKKDQKEDIRQEKKIPLDDFLIINVGALVPHKGQKYLLSAMVDVFKQKPKTRLLIAGDGPLKDNLETLAKDLKISDRVHFLGHVRNVLKYIILSDLFVFSSIEEGLGTSLLDAMAMGVPTVATKAGGIPEIYGSSDCSELAIPGDAKSLAERILSVIQNPKEAVRCEERGRERVRLFTVNKMADDYENLYEKMI